MKLEEFDYPLPKELIAQVPLKNRDDSRLMIVDRGRSGICLKTFKDITDHVYSGDVLVINDTRVFPARLFGKKNTGGKVELLLVRRLDGNLFSSLAKSSKPLKAGENITFGDDLTAEVTCPQKDGLIGIKFMTEEDIFAVLDRTGTTPLPPYIRRDGALDTRDDKNRYQTVYAEITGAVAAPTAGLHFTDELLDKLRMNGVETAKVTLHVGPGTFMPVRSEYITDHKMHEETFSVSGESIEKIARAKRGGGRIIAVGTTSVRVLETVFDEEQNPVRTKGDTSLFIYPGYRFKMVDALITNFHLPKSTLLMLVCAFGGTDLIKSAYKRAVEESFRFFSYGDAMYIT